MKSNHTSDGGNRYDARKLILLSLACLLFKPALDANASVLPEDGKSTPSKSTVAASRTVYPQKLHVGKHELSISYENNKVMLKSDGADMILHKVSSGFEPSKVGAEQLNSFLPLELQAYKVRNILLYTTAIRSTGGNGSGQCGAGAEIRLHALDIGQSPPKVVSGVLIGSCLESIELADQDMNTLHLGALLVDGGRLRLKFLNYKTADGTPAAVLSKDLKHLQFK